MNSCNIEPYEDENSPESNKTEANIESGTFKVDFDNKTYSADVVSATILDNVINISGLRSASQDAVIISVFATKTGTYSLGITQNAAETNSVTYATLEQEMCGLL